jgi:hypothetical protein
LDGERAVSVEQLKSLTAQIDARLADLARLDRYYTGQQVGSFVPSELRETTEGRLATLIVNWPRVIVDSIEERLDVEGFLVGGGEAADATLWDTWQASDMDEGSQLCHLDALVHGVAYVSVGLEGDRPRIAVESAHEMTVSYEPGTRRVQAAAKRWAEAGATFAVLYLPDVTERYEGRQASRLELVASEPHGLGAVPVVPFVNRPRAAGRRGESELTDVIKLTDAVSKLGTDMMITSEFHAQPRRWATGLQVPSGPDRERLQAEAAAYWDRATKGKTWLAGQGVAFGQFPSADLSNYVSAIGMLTGQIAAISGLPPHYLGVTTENPASADAIRSAEASLVMRAKRKQRTFGGSWEQVMRLTEALRRDVPLSELPPELSSIATVWRDPQTPTVAQAADAAVKLVQADIITGEQALEDLGYSPVQVERERTRRDQAVATAATAAVRAQVDEAQRLMREQNLSQRAAFAAVGLLQAANAMGDDAA